jgi:hypothetical protein
MEPKETNPNRQSANTPLAPATPKRSPLPRLISLPNPIAFSLLLMAVGGGLAAVAIPHIDYALSGSSSAEPTIISFAGMAIVMIVLTAVVIGVTSRLKAAASWRWLSLAFIYNAFIVLIKFSLAPASLYQANQLTQFDTGSLGGDPNGFFYYIVTAAVIALLYVAVFCVINWYTSPVRLLKRVTVGTAIVGILVVLLGGFWGWFLGGSAVQYIGFIFSTGIGLIVLFSLIAAAAVALAASRRAVDDDKGEVSGQELSVATFFTLGISLLVIYHFLWIVYMSTLVTVWPFKTYSPK